MGAALRLVREGHEDAATDLEGRTEGGEAQVRFSPVQTRPLEEAAEVLTIAEGIREGRYYVLGADGIVYEPKGLATILNPRKVRSAKNYLRTSLNQGDVTNWQYFK